jgi:hypothetical protein
LRQQGRLILAVDGLQPDQGHEVLWVVREVLSGDILYEAFGPDFRKNRRRTALVCSSMQTIDLQ